MNLITNDGVRIEYDDYNETANQTVVILSGIGGTRVIWQPQIEALVSHGYRVVNIDARNQGASQHTAKGRRMSRHAVDVYEIVQKLGLQSPYLMGNSMGAATCLAYVSLYGNDAVAGIIDVDQSPKMVNDSAWHYGYKNLRWDTFPQAMSEPLGKTTVQRLSAPLFAKVDAAKKSYPYDEALNLPFLVDHAFQDWRDVVINLSRPMLLVAGQQSPLFNSTKVNEVAKLSDWVQIERIHDSGHLVMAEQPVQFNRIMLSFLAQHGVRTAN